MPYPFVAAVLLAVPAVAVAQSAADIREKYTKYEYRVPVRDGTRLFTAVYVPKDAGPDKLYPILLTRTPYSAAPYGVDQFPDRLRPGAHLSATGYIFAVQDVRGQWMSEGKFENMRPHNPAKADKEFDESSDTWDSIDWLLKHVPHHNGKVGQTGVSYPGFYTVCGMIDAHPALVCASPQAPVTDWFTGDDFHHNGCAVPAARVQLHGEFRQVGERPEPTKKQPFTSRFDHEHA